MLCEHTPLSSILRDLTNRFANTILICCRSVIEEIAEGAEEIDLGGRSIAVRAYASWFNFKGADQQKSVSVLSGGERNRLQLAKVTWSQSVNINVQQRLANMERHYGCKLHRTLSFGFSVMLPWHILEPIC